MGIIRIHTQKYQDYRKKHMDNISHKQKLLNETLGSTSDFSKTG